MRAGGRARIWEKEVYVFNLGGIHTVFLKSVPFLTSVGLNRQMTENY